ncbi:glycosyltransferase family 2 protein [Amorphus sp. 3PC139-8]|uniref:glycosyltransferase family 2 protein n=1 Tax=Amorphus sp. 3PC139-8 TaxID=2735676 RepID=UPI00345DC9BA
MVRESATTTSSDGTITVSVVIANWNKAALTVACVDRLLEHVGAIGCEVIVVDNGSEAGERDELRAALATRPVRLIELPTNLYFGEANNIGAEVARGRYLLLLNNDTLVEPGFLEPMVVALDTAPRAKAVGARLLYEDGTLQEAGAYLTPESWSIQHGKREQANGLITGPGLYIVDYCSAACLLIERGAFLKAAGFDPLYDPAYFEDADLCLRLRSAGHFTYYCGDSAIVHLESRSSNEQWDAAALTQTVQANQKKFAARWGDYLARRLLEPSTMPVFRDVDWQPEPPAEALSSAHRLEGDGQIGKTEAWTRLITEATERADNRPVVFVADEPASRCRVYAIARDLGVELPPFGLLSRKDYS